MFYRTLAPFIIVFLFAPLSKAASGCSEVFVKMETDRVVELLVEERWPEALRLISNPNVKFDPNAKTKDGHNMISFVSSWYLEDAPVSVQTKLILALINRGADLSNTQAKAELMTKAAYFVDLKTYKSLYKQGGKIKVTDSFGSTPLQWSLGHANDSAIALWLIKKGVKINRQDKIGQTALHQAVEYTRDIDLKILKVLVKKGAKLNIKDDEGLTPLHNAVIHENAAAVKILVKAGANKKARNNQGLTPMELFVVVHGQRAMAEGVFNGELKNAPEDVRNLQRIYKALSGN